MARWSFWVVGVLGLLACAPKSARGEKDEGPASGGDTASKGGAPGAGGDATGGDATGGNATGGNATGGNATGGNATGDGGEQPGGNGGAGGTPATGGNVTAGRAGGGGAAGLGGAPGCAPRESQTCQTSPERCPTRRAEATTCSTGSAGMSAGPDQCACADAGTCASGQRCLTIYYPAQIGFGSLGTSRNECVADCGSDADCTNGQRCMSGQYYPVCSGACRFDQECTAECGGRCVPLSIPIHAGYAYNYAAARCVYPGSCGASSCAGCTSAGGAPSSSGPEHGCP